jgi:hypothetical protein
VTADVIHYIKNHDQSNVRGAVRHGQVTPFNRQNQINQNYQFRVNPNPFSTYKKFNRGNERYQNRPKNPVPVPPARNDQPPYEYPPPENAYLPPDNTYLPAVCIKTFLMTIN